MAPKSKKIKNKPRPPPAPGSQREDSQQDAPVEDQDQDQDQDQGQDQNKNQDSAGPEDISLASAGGQSTPPDIPVGQENSIVIQSLEFPQPDPDQQESLAAQPDPQFEKQDPPTEQQNSTGQDTVEEPLANSPLPPSATTTDNRPTGGRKGGITDDATKQVSNLASEVPNCGLLLPGIPQTSAEDKSSLKIKIHLNLHAKVKLELDAQIYGDVVIGLL
ncbi:hypothetical protein N7520_010344 [Penicillium odoratum]|uniref:uncharacterized protein n=1 Tax=Penicillium odoratum TaxID=1167516 RepID=UPI002546918F|nr:uncharacterized protein N7520_010344 [Penicillium odoratum]KAJ5745162.1 hypothetical protein N7520_010344 [Penicillium odoratum]